MVTMGRHVSFGPRVKARAMRLVEALLAYANDELENRDYLKIETRWEDNGERPYLAVKTQLRFLVELTALDKPNVKLKNYHVKEAIERLQNFVGILEDRRFKKRGSSDWYFALKLWTKDTQENLKRLDREWESLRPEKSKQATGDAPIDASSTEEEAINHNDRGVDSYIDNRLGEALRDFEEALEGNPDLAAAYYNRGSIYEQISDIKRAREEYQKAMIGGLAAAYSNMARLCILDGDYPSAVELLKKGLRLAEDDEIKVRYALWKNLGWVRLEQQRYDEAKEALKQAISLDRNRGAAHCLLARVLEVTGDSAAALVEWQYCGDRARDDHPDEDTWLATARQRLSNSMSSKPKSSQSNPPPKPPKPPKSRKPRLIDPRSDYNPLIPYIIRPRRTALLDRQPLLRWNGVPQATRYIVSFRTRKGTVWQVDTSETQLVYPGDPALEPGVEYLPIVESDTGVSSRDEAVPSMAKFRLLDLETVAQVQAEVEQARQEWTGEMQTLAVAYVYMKSELRAEAIDLLEAVVEEGSQMAAIYLTLGELYVEVGLSLKAKPFYLRAIELASEAGDLEEKTMAAVGLGEVSEALGNVEEAIARLNEAKEGYAALGDEEAVKELEEKLAELS